MIEKNTQHKFETTDVIVEMTEYPFEMGEEFHLSVKPSNSKSFEYVELNGNPKGEQSIVLRNGDFIMWVKAEGLADMLEKSVKSYRKGWRELKKSMES